MFSAVRPDIWQSSARENFTENDEGVRLLHTFSVAITAHVAGLRVHETRHEREYRALDLADRVSVSGDSSQGRHGVSFLVLGPAAIEYDSPCAEAKLRAVKTRQEWLVQSLVHHIAPRARGKEHRD